MITHLINTLSPRLMVIIDLSVEDMTFLGWSSADDYLAIGASSKMVWKASTRSFALDSAEWKSRNLDTCFLGINRQSYLLDAITKLSMYLLGKSTKIDCFMGPLGRSPCRAYPPPYKTG
jgi:hypothetical protein